jgi:hypothetical protein
MRPSCRPILPVLPERNVLRLEERTRVQALNDFPVFCTMALVATGSFRVRLAAA